MTGDPTAMSNLFAVMDWPEELPIPNIALR